MLLTRLALLGLVAAASAAPLAVAPAAATTMLAPSCPAGNAALTRLSQPLPRLAKALRDGGPVKIVAIGSSSTAGAGASSRTASYPSRLEAALRQRFPGIDITVVNRGINGQDAPEMLARFNADVAAEQPTLVLWQAGVNALFRADGLDTAEGLLRDAIARTRALGADIVIIDPQYSPKVIGDSEALDMLRLQQRVADEEGVSVFHRFALMREWHEAKGLAFEAFTFKDGFHMNDFGYECFAKGLGGSLAANVDSQLRSADVSVSPASLAKPAKAGTAIPGAAATTGKTTVPAATGTAPEGLPDSTLTP
ncbi:lysophospholipase L1-like esterase [Ancylobacter sp. 3268]|uniref:SGNH/GDSL hydrolase family protein n=1 Tax=Ancylobacter sp. 3268 TaxID=2817752 RepID=UPI002857970B|nr:SGNH/GDSL hydrolase family protein [Ancylobacter sp. 3268]MDR6954677.1 lysophospholipase L1-like esterase [Ancylobacter sp. 3268]